MRVIFIFILTYVAIFLNAQNLIPSTQPNLPQKELMSRGYGMFIHFGMNTFAELEWSDGSIPVETYCPTNLGTVAK